VLDSDGPYLVVAADKGTAAFSDIANALAEERGFWLGDAFASGGTHGYDHKKLGITARGAWESARRHLREMGRDLERGAGRLNWVIVRIPFDVSKVWGSRAVLRVKGDINGFAFGTSLFPTGDGRHVMLVNKKMQAGAKTSVGAAARFVLEPDTAPRIVAMPAELESALDEVRALRRWYDQLSPSMRKYTAEWVAEVKSPEARERRAAQLAERLLATMEAERELPPILRAAFARDPRAYEGWKEMSVTQRRGHLLAIFYYRDPQSQARRVAQAVREAFKRSQKPGARIKN
jgi:uncharacterized protein YdeI (YjbR/CyaY-like superfamily)